MHNVGVTGIGSLIGQGIIKSILKGNFAHEYSIIGFDYFPNTVGSYWCKKSYILPDILMPMNEENWLAQVMEIIDKENLKILFIGVDFELKLFAKYKVKIEARTQCKIVVSSNEVIEISDDKYKTFRFLKESGLYYPQTVLPHEVDVSSLKFPLIVKPRIGARSVGVSLVKKYQDLNAALYAADDPIIQEYIGDNTKEYTCGVIAFEGVLKSSIALKRSLKAGNTHTSEYLTDTPQIILDYIEAITHKLKPFGACNFQLRLGVDGIPKLFEINARHSGTTYMRSLFGFHEIDYILKYLLEGKEIEFKLREGKAMRFFEEQLI